jgi:glycosyltransferase involved in cell wall biosynthesis
LKRWVPTELWGRIHVVRCAVDETFFDEATPVDAASRALVCVGRLTQDKAQSLLLEAFASVIGEGVDAKLVFAGGGELRPLLERRARELGVADRVTITGSVDGAAVRRLIAESRSVVLTSFAEGLPVVIMEALAMGRPVLSTYIAGIPELVRPDENGWLIPAGNGDAIAHALREVMATPVARLREMGERGRALVRQRHLAATETATLEGLFARAALADKEDESR